MRKLQVVIAGMHRSNTSLVAKAFASAGLFLGDNLLPPGEHNKEGYFEDVDIINLHDSWLNVRGYSSWDIYKCDPSLHDFSSSEKQNAKRLIEEKYAGRMQYGFKDPRATLFLPIWESVLENPLFVLVFRSPVLTTRSLLRRKDYKRYSRIKLVQAVRALKTWYVYNSYLLDFAKKRRDQVILIHAPEDIVDSNRAVFLAEKLKQKGLALPSVRVDEVVNFSLLNTEAPWVLSFFSSFFPEVNALYKELIHLKNAQA